MKTSSLLPALLSAALTVALCAASPDELRAESEKLIEKAKQAKAEGRGDEAQELMGRAKKIQVELREQLATAGGAKGGDEKAERARREAEQMRRQIEELHRAGQHDEAQHLEKKFAECNGPRSGGDGPERVRHVMEAIEHLRAAGLGEPAEGLARVAEKMRAELEHRGAPAPDPAQDPLREVRDTVIQLRGQMEKMQRQLEELRAQAGKAHGEKPRE